MFKAMRKWFVGLVVLLAFIAVMIASIFEDAWRTEEPLGDCVGLGQMKVDTLRYEPNVGNIIIGVLLIETIIVPVYIVLTSLECPVAVVTP